MAEIAVLGAGAWGTALAIQAARANVAGVALWARDPAEAAMIAMTRENTRRLPGAILPASVAMTSSLDEALSGAELVILAIPVQHLRGLLARLPAALPPVLIAAKGVEQTTLLMPLELVASLRPQHQAIILSGPNFAHEIAAGLTASAVVASPDTSLHQSVIARLGTPAFRLYGNLDAIGVQVGGAAKNVIAIAAGIVIGAGLGENARAALITRGLAEIGRLAAGLGGRSETVAGLSGLGDLLLTATSLASRNTSLGVALGRGQSLTEILAAREAVTEGVTTAPALLARAAAEGIELPISEAVAAILAGRLRVREAMETLLARPMRQE
jgi:glycerol-3-phosphate dehydrogenase (NAD(P)+)